MIRASKFCPGGDYSHCTAACLSLNLSHNSSINFSNHEKEYGKCRQNSARIDSSRHCRSILYRYYIRTSRNSSSCFIYSFFAYKRDRFLPPLRSLRYKNLSCLAQLTLELFCSRAVKDVHLARGVVTFPSQANIF